METIFKVGDKVFDISFGWGEVEEIQKGNGINYQKNKLKY